MRHAGHFARLVGLLAFAVVGFLVLRSQLVPKDFGVTGRFRQSALKDAQAREPRHIGSAACGECHDEIANAWAAGKHKTPQCENCHGPGLMHTKTVAEESTSAYPDKILKNKLALRPVTGITECKWCHLKTFERPSALKSIANVEAHIVKNKGTFTATSKCTDCHNPHTTVVKP
jgi:hypothetical protein